MHQVRENIKRNTGPGTYSSRITPKMWKINLLREMLFVTQTCKWWFVLFYRECSCVTTVSPVIHQFKKKKKITLMTKNFML